MGEGGLTRRLMQGISEAIKQAVQEKSLETREEVRASMDATLAAMAFHLGALERMYVHYAILYDLNFEQEDEKVRKIIAFWRARGGHHAHQHIQDEEAGKPHEHDCWDEIFGGN